MPGQLIILCNVERVPVLDTAKQLGFGMNLTVAWDRTDLPPETTAFDQRLLQPWAWPAIRRVSACWSHEGALADAIVCDVIDKAPAEDITRLRQALQKQYDELKTDRQNLFWPPVASPGTEDARKIAISESRRPWHVLLLNLATASGVLSRQLHLTVSFRCDAPADRDKQLLVAVPILDAVTDTPESPAVFPGGRRPINKPVPCPEVSNLMAWQYGDGDPRIRACTMPCAIDVQDSHHPSIDLTTQWVATATGTKAQKTVAYEDWEASLPARAAEGFRQDRFFRDYMQAEGMKAFRKGELRWLIRDRALACVRDRAGAGVSPGTSGRRAAAVLLERRPKSADPKADAKTKADPVTLTLDQWKELERADRNAFATLAEWIDFLRGCVDPRSDLKSLSPKAPEGPPIDDNTIAAEFARMLELLDDPRPVADGPSAMWKVFLRLWEHKLLKNADVMKLIDAPLTVRILDKLRAEASAAGDSPQLLSLLNDELLGRFWPAFLRSNKADAASDPFGTALVETCYPAYALYYARLRWGASALDAPAACIPRPDPKKVQAPTEFITFPQEQPVFKPDVTDVGLPKDTLDELETFFCSWIRRSRETLRPTAPDVSQTPAPLTFQVARLSADSEQEPNALPDLLRRFAGFGVLMREQQKTPGPWHCLNLAQLHLSNDDEAPVYGNAVLVPYRLHYRGDLRRVCTSYNNQSIVADSPLSDASAAAVELQDQVASDVGAVLRYRYAKSARMPGLKFGSTYDVAVFTLSNTGILPSEIAGNEAYQIADQITFEEKVEVDLLERGVIQQGIPYQRTVPVGGLRLCGKGPANRDTPMALPTIPSDVAPLALELVDTLMETSARGDVHPPLILLCPEAWRAKTAEPRGASSAEFCVRLPQVTWSCYDRWTSADRTVTREQRIALIAAIHQRHAEQHPRKDREAIPAPLRQPDTCVDDPAVSQLLHVRLNVEENEKRPLVEESFVEVEAPSVVADDPLSGFTAGRAHFTCEWLSKDAPDARAAKRSAGALLTVDNTTTSTVAPGQQPLGANHVRIQVREGRVYLLTVSACVPLDVADGQTSVPRFDPVIMKPSRGSLPRRVVRTKGTTKREYYLMSPTHILLEAATEDLPSEPELFAACGTRFEKTEKNIQRVRVEFGPKTPDADTVKRFRTIQRADVDCQAWRWQGRPTPLHPHLRPRDAKRTASTDLGDEVRAWVAQEFGERADDLSTTAAMTAAPLTRKGGTSSTPVPGVRAFAYEQVLQDDAAHHDPRGHHFRYSVKVFSRYALLMPDRRGERYAKIDVRHADSRPVQTRWHEVFVPSRRVPPLDPPRVKLILPLTEGGERKIGGSPGLLVVLNEAWYETAGLGEALAVDIGHASGPWADDAKQQRTYLELGPDPIVHAYKKDSSGPDGSKRPPLLYAEPREKWNVRIGDSDAEPSDDLPACIIGPVGHYFDRSNNSALFVGTSFIIPPPHDLDRKDAKNGWYFARMRFRRKVVCREPRGDVNTASTYAPDDKSWPLRTYYSEPSDDFWVQYLPEFSIFDGLTEDLKSLTPILNFAQGSLHFDDGRTGTTKAITPTPSDRNIFRLYAVLTRTVFDAAAHMSEVYVAVFAQQSDRKSWTTDIDLSEIPLSTDDEYCVRVIEVQIPSPAPKSGAATHCLVDPPKPSELWRWLFPDTTRTENVRGTDMSCDAPGRIVRISAPVKTKSRRRTETEQ